MLGRLLIAAGVICLLFKMITGRWPWQPKVSTREQAKFHARRLLGVEARASREEILVAHRRLVTLVHPDKGGTNQQVHEANAARDLLLGDLPGDR
jgi:DnaJ homolog subfamily C member 19